jgi:hypothetical protein
MLFMPAKEPTQSLRLAMIASLVAACAAARAPVQSTPTPKPRATILDGGAPDAPALAKQELFAPGSNDRVWATQRTSKGNIVLAVGSGFMVFDPHEPGRLVRTVFEQRTPLLDFAFANHSDHAVVALQNSKELWSTEPLARIAILQSGSTGGELLISDKQGDAEVRVALSSCFEEMPELDKSAKWTKTDDTRVCGYKVFDGSTGALVSKIGVPNAESGSGTLSADGKYLTFSTIEGHRVFRTDTGAFVLKRLGTDAPEEGHSEVFLIEENSLVMSRKGVVELDDLSNGKLVRSQRYPIGPNGEIEHVIVPERKLLASLSSEANALFLWSYRATTPAKRVSLRKALRGACSDCKLETSGQHTLLIHGFDDAGSFQLVFDLDTQSFGKRTTGEREVGRNESIRIVRTDTDEKSVCRIETLNEPKRNVVVPETYCETPIIDKTLVIAHEDGWLSIWDTALDLVPSNVAAPSVGAPLPTTLGREVLRYGSEDATSSMGPRLRKGVLGFRDHTNRSMLWLTTQPPPAEFPPFASDQTKTRASVVETSTYRYALERSFANRQTTVIVAHDLTGAEVLRFPLPLSGFVQPILASEGRALVFSKPKGRPTTAMVCEVNKGCTKLAERESFPFAFEGKYALYENGAHHELLNIETEQSTDLDASCGYPLGLTNIGSEVRVVCQRDGVDARTKRVSVIDLEGAKRSEIQLVDVNLNSATLNLFSGTRMITPQHAEGQGTFGLIDLERGLMANIRVTPEGALVVYADGRVEGFGATTEIEPAVFCMSANVLRPLSTCRRAVDAKGTLESVLQSNAPK